MSSWSPIIIQTFSGALGNREETVYNHPLAEVEYAGKEGGR
jgi:hypothetical protein